jgi:arylsulfatase A-like enzyme
VHSSDGQSGAVTIAPVTRPNVILVVFDTARADVFEPYGAPTGQTPVVADLARRGTAAMQMYAASGWTLPSHAAMFTGLEPRSAGLARAPGRTPPSCKTQVESHRARFLPEVLRGHGYSTKATSANLWITPESGFATGFDEFVVARGNRSTSMGRPGARAAATWALRALKSDADDGAGHAFATIRRFLAEADDRPFFWFVNLVECHSPYLPPAPYMDRGPIARVRAAAACRKYLTLQGVWRTCLTHDEVPARDLAIMRHFYERSIVQLDDWLGRTLEAVEQTGRLDDTLVIVTSDHGENFGENRLVGHSFSLDNRLIRVPFVAAGPGTMNLDRVASLVELPRLIAEAVGLPSHPWDDARLDGGVAVAQFDAPATRETAEVAIRDWGLGRDQVTTMTSPQTAVTDGRHKLVRTGLGDHLYDTVADPIEERTLDVRAASDNLRRVLENAAAPVTPVTATPSAPSNEDLEDRMRLLGYM